ncbi:hypothetical protein E2C01_065617 [Portunus trituberculatus]|uniref:Uncharacterized protein n=1 Tax=Portunus trituberculatus TaxID=210409 RepID=A0A5B7HF19_PORTR|nr:hypothetical protein [Portunus trituberculatus]
MHTSGTICHASVIATISAQEVTLDMRREERLYHTPGTSIFPRLCLSCLPFSVCHYCSDGTNHTSTASRSTTPKQFESFQVLYDVGQWVPGSPPEKE